MKACQGPLHVCLELMNLIPVILYNTPVYDQCIFYFLILLS